MADEIERKFLLKNDFWKQEVTHSKSFRQGYIRTVAPPRVSVRVRIEGDEAFLTLKGPARGITRSEYQYPVPLADAEDMLRDLVSCGEVEKIRHYVSAPPYTWEIDEYLGENAGLVTAEIELPAEDAVFNVPHWLGKEVTGIPRYYNSQLAKRPWRTWTPEEQA